MANRLSADRWQHLKKELGREQPALFLVNFLFAADLISDFLPQRPLVLLAHIGQSVTNDVPRGSKSVRSFSPFFRELPNRESETPTTQGKCGDLIPSLPFSKGSKCPPRKSPAANCGKIGSIPDENLEGKATCPHCKAVFRLRSVTEPDHCSLVWADGQVIANEFVVEGKLGQGGMGIVYLVGSQSTGRQFAVKRVPVQNEAKRHDFLTELVTWQNLPEHPFLAPCRFFRLIGDDVAIFTDYVDAGTLADWITDGRLTSFPEMMDVAIQFAWGLHVAHEAGFIHRDVKPGNALMTVDGQLKVADFGLAQCCRKAGETATNNENIVVSSGGMTRAYASPEQLKGQSLWRQTDIWSWAVSVLDMFVGKVPACRSGATAESVLDAYLASGPMNPKIAAMPKPLINLLRRCFHPDPKNRLGNLGEIARVLAALYRETPGGQPYPRKLSYPDEKRNQFDHHNQTSENRPLDS